MPLVRNITTDDLGYAGLTIPAGEAIEVAAGVAKRMTEAMPDKFRMARKTKNRSMADKQSENRAVS